MDIFTITWNLQSRKPYWANCLKHELRFLAVYKENTSAEKTWEHWSAGKFIENLTWCPSWTWRHVYDISINCFMLVTAIVRGFIDLFYEDSSGEDFRHPILTHSQPKVAKQPQAAPQGTEGFKTPHSTAVKPRTVGPRPNMSRGRWTREWSFRSAILTGLTLIRPILARCTSLLSLQDVSWNSADKFRTNTTYSGCLQTICICVKILIPYFSA